MTHSYLQDDSNPHMLFTYLSIFYTCVYYSSHVNGHFPNPKEPYKLIVRFYRVWKIILECVSVKRPIEKVFNRFDVELQHWILKIIRARTHKHTHPSTHTRTCTNIHSSIGKGCNSNEVTCACVYLCVHTLNLRLTLCI